METKVTISKQGFKAEVYNEGGEWWYDVWRESDGYNLGGNTEGLESKDIAREEAIITIEDVVNNPSHYFD